MALEAKEQVFLLGGMRFKLDFSPEGCDECGAVDGYNTAARPLDQYADELQGRWVALVSAENDCHLELVNLKEQRDELLAVVREIVSAQHAGPITDEMLWAWQRCKAAIAKATGGSE